MPWNPWFYSKTSKNIRDFFFFQPPFWQNTELKYLSQYFMTRAQLFDFWCTRPNWSAKMNDIKKVYPDSFRTLVKKSNKHFCIRRLEESLVRFHVYYQLEELCFVETHWVCASRFINNLYIFKTKQKILYLILNADIF